MGLFLSGLGLLCSFCVLLWGMDQMCTLDQKKEKHRKEQDDLEMVEFDKFMHGFKLRQKRDKL